MSATALFLSDKLPRSPTLWTHHLSAIVFSLNPSPQAVKASFKCKSVAMATQYNDHAPGMMAGSGDDAEVCLLNSEPMLLSCAGEPPPLCW